MSRDASFGRWLQQRRKALDLTQDDLGRRVGCSGATIRKIEAGERRPSKQVAERLAASLDLAPAERQAFLQFARSEGFSTPPDGPSQPVAAKPQTTLHRHPTNLPLQLTPLIGREQDVAAVCNRLLRDEARLLTLTGPAGIGKTRLSLKVASDLLHGFAGGVFFVPLAPLRGRDLVGPTIAQTLGITETGSQPPVEGLKDVLRDKDLLLVLDNFEQVLPAASLVVDLLAACPRLKVLVTSRTRLHVRGERQFEVRPLALPDLQRLPTVDGLVRYSAVALFMKRAQAVKPDFTLTDENAAVVAEVCARLDGLPLAIELAAAHSRLLSPRAMLARLGGTPDARPLQLLTRGANDLPARHQTLRDAIDWSYDLLEPAEQTLFARLGVFVGGCTLEAAEAVCGGGRGAEGQRGRGDAEGVDASSPMSLCSLVPLPPILDGLESLLDKSLLQQGAGAEDEPRFTMLELIREYALERLEAGGEAEALRQRHAAYFLMLAEAAEPHLASMGQKLWWRRLEVEHDNLRAALQWTLDHRDAETALRLGGALWQFWYTRGYLSEGYQWLEQALALHPNPQPLTPNPLVAKALNGAGTLAWSLGKYARAEELLQASLRLQQELGDKPGMARSLNYLGAVAHLQGNYGEGTRLYEESLALRRALGDMQGVATTLNNLGLMSVAQQDYARARVLLEESLALDRELGDQWNSAYALGSLGWVALHQNNFAQAQRFFQASLALLKDQDDRRCIVAGIEGLADALGEQGEAARAARLFGAAEVLREAMGERIGPTNQGPYERALASIHARLDDAAFATAWGEGRAMTLEQAITYALVPPD